MEKQEYKSKWDELAREIGAEIPPETQQREEAVSAPQVPPAARPIQRSETPAESRPPLPKKAPGDWDSLAGELGLPPAPPSEKPAKPTAKPVAEQRPVVTRDERNVTRDEPMREEPPRQEARRAAPRPEAPRREEPRREAPRGESPRPRRPDRPKRERNEQGERRDRPEPRRDQRDKRRPPRELDEETTAGSEPKPAKVEDRIERRPERPAPPREEPPKPATVSLWHKIFGSPAEQTAKIADDSDQPDASEPSDVLDEPRSAGSGFADPHPDIITTEERGDDFDRDDAPSSTEDDGTDRKRGRPRRRRGRGRGRRPEGQPAENPAAGPRDDRRPRPPMRAKVEEQEDDDDDELDKDLEEDDTDIDDSFGELDADADGDDGDDEMAGAGPSRSRSVLQRAIPSWDEAIGFIVDTNMQSRTQRRPPSRGGPRDNGGRGRPRGGRRKPSS